MSSPVSPDSGTRLSLIARTGARDRKSISDPWGTRSTAATRSGTRTAGGHGRQLVSVQHRREREPLTRLTAAALRTGQHQSVFPFLDARAHLEDFSTILALIVVERHGQSPAHKCPGVMMGRRSDSDHVCPDAFHALGPGHHGHASVHVILTAVGTTDARATWPDARGRTTLGALTDATPPPSAGHAACPPTRPSRRRRGPGTGSPPAPRRRRRAIRAPARECSR